MKMKGSYNVTLKDRKFNYTLTVNRKITLIRGDSGTGKTTMLNSLRKAIRGDIGRSFACEIPCIVLDMDEWLIQLETKENCIFFLDEDFYAIRHKELDKAIKRASAYFVIIVRKEWTKLSYSMDEMYKLKSKDKIYTIEKSNWRENNSVSFKPDIIITEDENSGYRFFQEVAGFDVECISSQSNSKIMRLLENSNFINSNILIVLDASAFGPYIKGLYDYIKNDLKVRNNNYYILAPESFEFMILESAMYNNHPIVKDFIINPYEYADTSYTSIESYSTELLKKISKEAPRTAYTKGRSKEGASKINNCYIKDCCVRPSDKGNYLTSGCKFQVNGNKLAIIMGKYGEQLNLSNLRRSYPNPENAWLPTYINGEEINLKYLSWVGLITKGESINVVLRYKNTLLRYNRESNAFDILSNRKVELPEWITDIEVHGRNLTEITKYWIEDNNESKYILLFTPSVKECFTIDSKGYGRKMICDDLKRVSYTDLPESELIKMRDLLTLY